LIGHVSSFHFTGVRRWLSRAPRAPCPATERS
jgi:hypothetical protein